MIEAEVQHFSYGLVGGPMFVSNAIGGDENAGAVFAELAMNEDFWLGIFVKER